MTTKIIRSVDSEGTFQTYWTGSKFSIHLDESKEYRGGRALASDMQKARDSLNLDSSIDHKEITSVPLYSDPSLEAKFQADFKLIRDYRSVGVSNDNIDLSLLDSTGNLIPEKVQELVNTRIAEKKAEFDINRVKL